MKSQKSGIDSLASINNSANAVDLSITLDSSIQSTLCARNVGQSANEVTNLLGIYRIRSCTIRAAFHWEAAGRFQGDSIWRWI